jgi:hypothetical protein
MSLLLFRLDGVRTRDSGFERTMSYHLTTNPVIALRLPKVTLAAL